MTTTKKITVHCCNDCGCEVGFETGYCEACDTFPGTSTYLVDDDETRPEGHKSPEDRETITD